MTWWEKKAEKNHKIAKTIAKNHVKIIFFGNCFENMLKKRVRNMWWDGGRCHALAAWRVQTSSSVGTPPLLMALDTSRWDLVGDATCVAIGYAWRSIFSFFSSLFSLSSLWNSLFSIQNSKLSSHFVFISVLVFFLLSLIFFLFWVLFKNRILFSI
jgi:hypothetical protein